MRLTIKKIGNNGLHVYIPKESGYKEGDMVYLPDKDADELDEKINAAVRNQIEQLKGGY